MHACMPACPCALVPTSRGLAMLNVGLALSGYLSMVVQGELWYCLVELTNSHNFGNHTLFVGVCGITSLGPRAVLVEVANPRTRFESSRCVVITTLRWTRCR